MIDPSVLDPSYIESINDMLQLAIMCCNEPPKAIAAQIGCSLSMMYKVLDGTRRVPNKVRHELSKINLVSAATVALEATGFIRLFGYRKVDRHVQSLILELKVSDKQVADGLDKLPVLLLNKNSKKDLSDDDIAIVKDVVYKLVDRANANINLLMELDSRYDLNLERYLSGHAKKPQTAVTSTAVR